MQTVIKIDIKPPTPTVLYRYGGKLKPFITTIQTVIKNAIIDNIKHVLPVSY